MICSNAVGALLYELQSCYILSAIKEITVLHAVNLMKYNLKMVGFHMKWDQLPVHYTKDSTSSIWTGTWCFYLCSILPTGGPKFPSKFLDQFTSRLFVIPRKDGSLRPVINLKPREHYVAA